MEIIKTFRHNNHEYEIHRENDIHTLDDLFTLLEDGMPFMSFRVSLEVRQDSAHYSIGSNWNDHAIQFFTDEVKTGRVDTFMQR